MPPPPTATNRKAQGNSRARGAVRIGVPHDDSSSAILNRASLVGPCSHGCGLIRYTFRPQPVWWHCISSVLVILDVYALGSITAMRVHRVVLAVDDLVPEVPSVMGTDQSVDTSFSCRVTPQYTPVRTLPARCARCRGRFPPPGYLPPSVPTSRGTQPPEYPGG